MRWTILLALGVGLVASGRSAGHDKAEAERKALAGTWRVLAIEADGKDVPDERATKFRFVVAEKGFTWTWDGKAVSAGALHIDPAKRPKELDMELSEGTRKGKTDPYIYELKGDVLILCGAETGKSRPTALTTKAGQAMYVLKRVK